MNNTLKSLLFWLVLVIAAIGVYYYAVRLEPGASTRPNDVAGEWNLAGRVDQPCAIFRQGTVLVIVNERGDVATGKLEGDTRIVVLKGEGWESGLTAEIQDGGKSLAWRDGAVWTRPSDSKRLR